MNLKKIPLLSRIGSFASKTANSFTASSMMLAGILMVLMLLNAQASHAQGQNTGTIAGNVTDTQGRGIPHATIKLTSIDEGTVATVQADGLGQYLISSVKIGGYILTVTAPNFSSFTADSILVDATSNVHIDAKLSLGSVETVTVEAPSSTVDTRSSTIATVIDPTLVRELPVDGNNVVALAALLPGVTNVFAPTTFTSDTGGPSFNASGARNNQNLFLFDGMFWNNVYYNTGLNFPSSLTLSEVSVQLNGFKAQYGRNVGSIFNALSRSGTNQIHGDVWEYIQNQAFNSADYISQKNPHLVQNQFGASIGGPLYRNKAFFYLAYQDLRSATEVDTKAQTPTLAERALNADGTPRPCVTPGFAGLSCASFAEDFLDTQPLVSTSGSCIGLTTVQCYTAGKTGINSPVNTGGQYYTTGIDAINSTYHAAGGVGTSPCIALLQSVVGASQYLPNAELPSICINPVSSNIMSKYLPLPTVFTGTALPYAYPSAQQPRNDQEGLARVDWNLGRHTIDARFFKTYVNDVTSNGASQTSPTVADYEQDLNEGGITSGNIGDTLVLRPNLLNVFRIGYKRYDYNTYPLDSTTAVDLGSNFTTPGVPSLPRISVTNRFGLGSTNSTYSYSVNSDTEVTDNVTLTKGKHNFQFGAQSLSLQYIHRFDYPLQMGSSGQFTGNAETDFELGLISALQVGNRTNVSAAEHAFYFYAQDDWRVSSRMTLNLGMRYELPFPWYQPDGQSVTFISGYQSYKFPNTPSSLAFQGDPGVPSTIIHTKFSNWAPRFGFAYDVFGTGKTAIRGGFGIFYDALNANTTGVGQPYHYAAQYNEPDGSYSAPLSGATPLLALPPVPANYSGPANAVFGLPNTINFADPNVTEPYTEGFNFGIQQHIAAGTLEVNYVGRLGRHQLIPYDLNPDIVDCTGAYYQANPNLYCSPLILGPNGKPIDPSGTAASNQSSNTARARYPQFNYGGGGIVDNNSVGSSSYNALQVIYIQRSKSSLTTTASYTYSRSEDDQSSGTTNSSSLPGTPNVNSNFGPSDYNATHVLNAGWSLRLPNLKRVPRFAQTFLNDWSFGGIFNARTGMPFNITLASDAALSAEPNQRPPLAAGLTKYVPLASNRHRTAKVAEWFNVAAFNNDYANSVIPGYTPITRNYLYGPAFIETDFSLRKALDFGYRGMRMDVRADAFNVWNTPNLANPNGSISSSPTQSATTGEVLSTVGKSGAGTNGRRVQFALIFHY